MVHVGSNSARFGAHDFPGAGNEPFRTSGADKRLRGGKQTGEEEEAGEGGDLGVGEDGGFPEDRKARPVSGRKMRRRRATVAYKPTMSSCSFWNPPSSHCIFSRL